MATAFLISTIPGQSAAQVAASSPAAAPPPSPGATAASPLVTRTQVLTLAQMGANYPIPLRGVDPDHTLNVGVRLDEVDRKSVV